MKNGSTDTLSDTIYSRVTDDLRMAIVSGDFESGERLKMVDLIQRFGTSQMPIREALQQLQGEGLITIIPNRGAQVKVIDHDFVSNIYDLRIAIESFLIEKACKSKNMDWVDELKRAQDVYDSMIEIEDIPKIIEANHHFHNIHNSVAGNKVALETLERSNRLVTVLRTTYGYTKERILQVSAEHHEMIMCLEKGYTRGVLAVYIEHVKHGRSNMLQEIPVMIEKKKKRRS